MKVIGVAGVARRYLRIIQFVSIVVVAAIMAALVAVASHNELPTTPIVTRAYTAPAAATAPSKPLTVMPVGDSVTQGFGGDFTWRYWFWKEFQRQRVSLDFVGPSEGFIKGYGTRYENPKITFDTDHAALGGSQIQYHAAHIDQEMAAYRPDVVALELGINNLVSGNQAPGVVASELEALMNQIWADKPDTKIMLAQLTPVQANPVATTGGATVNALLEQQYAHDSRVMLAYNRTAPTLPWDTSTFTFDGLHPNATGQTLLAHRFAQAFYAAGYLRQPPQVYQVRTWAPDITPVLTLAGDTATVDWSEAVTEVKVSGVRVLTRKAGSSATTTSGWYGPGLGSMTKTLDAGTWYVALQPKRGTMVGAVGDYTTVVVKSAPSTSSKATKKAKSKATKKKSKKTKKATKKKSAKKKKLASNKN